MSKRQPHFSFLLEELENSPIASRIQVRPMFGSHAVYVDEKIVFILRKKDDPKTARDNGVWIATAPEQSDSVRREIPALRPIELFSARGRKGFSGWLNLPESDRQFEETALAICKRVINGDPRIGKIPKPRRVPKTKPSKLTRTPRRR